jgi:peptidyl-prolyl cis-trans isomerase A (cyclophilin A)
MRRFSSAVSILTDLPDIMLSKIATIALSCSLLFACGAEEPVLDTKMPAPAELVWETPAKPAEAAAEEESTSEPATEVEATLEVAPKEPSLKDPSSLMLTAPANYKVKFETTKGDFVVEVERSWAPLGADRFFSLVKGGFFDDTAFFRAIEGFMVQFGLNGDPNVNMAWGDARIKDDPVVESNTRGRLTFAMGGPNTRTSQMFISYGNNQRLDPMGFSAIGEVSKEGMKVVDSLYTGYGEGAPGGNGPAQQRIQYEGNVYLKKDFPKLDYINAATVVE